MRRGPPLGTVAITGSSGFLGQRVHQRLLANGHEVVGIDLRAPTTDATGAFRMADVRSEPDMQRALEGVDSVVHLAWAAPDGRPDADVNVVGTRVLLDVARARGLDAVVVMSSAMVYGAAPATTGPLDEQAPLRAPEGVEFVTQKLAVERLVAQQPEGAPRSIVMRPAMVVGADSDNLVTRSLQDNRLVAVRGHAPALQFVHVDDLAAAIVVSLDGGLSGPVNVACDGSIDTVEVRALLGRRVLEVRLDVARTLVGRANDLGLTRLPAAALDWIMHPWVVDTAKLRATGWQPSIDNRDAVGLLAASARPEHGSAVRRVGVAAGVVGGVLALGAAARWRRPVAVEPGEDPDTDTDPDPDPDGGEPPLADTT